MPSGRSRIPFAHILRFAYFTLSALSLVWMLLQYGGVNFVSVMIVLPAFGYLALHLVSLVNMFKKDKFLVGSSVDVLSLSAQKWIHRAGLVLPLPILLYAATFGSLVATYNVSDDAAYNRTVEFSSFETQLFGKSVIWNYLTKPVSVEPVPAAANSADVDFGPYMADLQKRIKHNWFPPKCNETRRVKTTFSIDKNGVILNAKVSEHSNELSDKAALDALRYASPARPLPAGSPDKVDIEFTFDYNVFDSEPVTAAQ